MASKRKRAGYYCSPTYPNYIYCTAKIRLSFDREKFQKKFERGRTKAENHPYRGGGIANFGGSWLICRKECVSLHHVRFIRAKIIIVGLFVCEDG